MQVAKNGLFPEHLCANIGHTCGNVIRFSKTLTFEMPICLPRLHFEFMNLSCIYLYSFEEPV
jgi:hypothetical protein